MTSAAWYPDPMHRHQWRWWSGVAWTDHISDQGVVGTDALEHPMTTWAPPTNDPAPAASMFSAAASARRGTPVSRRAGVAAVALLAAIAVVGFVLLLNRGDSNAKQAGSSSALSTTLQSTAPSTVAATTATTIAVTVPPSTVVATTLAPTTLPPATTPPATTPPAATGDVLAAALPGAADAPADWVLDSEPVTAPVARTGDGVGYCSLENDTGRAQSMASIGQAYGTSWKQPSGGWFGVDAFAFGTEADAQAFLTETELRANSCMAVASTYTRPESEVQWFLDAYAEEAQWTVTDTSAAFTEPTGDAAFLLRTVRTRAYTLADAGDNYAATISSLGRYERHGRVVLTFWLDGNSYFSGFDNTGDMGTYQPIDADLDALAATFRATTVQRLTAAGAL